jgi:hypothetical protein
MSAPYAIGTLGYVRWRLVEETGRFDLVADAEGGDWSDDGADIHINRAARWLDSKLRMPTEPSWLYKTISANQELVTFTRPRRVLEVFVRSGDVRRRLVQSSVADTLRALYAPTSWWTPKGSWLINDQISNMPQYWAPYWSGVKNDVQEVSVEGMTFPAAGDAQVTVTGHPFKDDEHVYLSGVTFSAGGDGLNGEMYQVAVVDANTISLNGTEDATGTYDSGGTLKYLENDMAARIEWARYYAPMPVKDILLSPSPNQDMLLELLCEWRQERLSDDTDQSFWTLEGDGELLVMTAAMHLEGWNRNQQGLESQKANCLDEVKDIRISMLAEQMGGPPEVWVREG